MNSIETIGVGVEAKGIDKTNRDLDTFEKKATLSSKAADALTGSVKGLIAGYVGLQSLQALAGAIDKHTKYTAQLKLATRTQDEFNRALKDASRIASTSQADISSIATLYARLSNSLRDLNVAQKEIANVTETVALGLKISGATAEETSSAMLQLSQAFGSGVLRGEEFNAMSESAPILMRALAESMGVTVGALRNMASEGQITSDVLLKAFGDEKLIKLYREQAKEVNTISGAWQNVKNAFLEAIGLANQKSGTSNWLSDTFSSLAEYLRAVKLVIEDGDWFDKLRFFTIGNLSADLTDVLRNGKRNQSVSGTITRSQKTTSATIDNEYLKKLQEDAKKAEQESNKIKLEHARELAKSKAEIERIFNEENDRNIRVQAEAQFQREVDYLEKLNKEKEKSEIEEEKRKKEMLDRLQKEANDNYNEAQKAQLDAIREQEREWERMYDNISRSLVDSIVRGFEQGKSMIQNFKDAITNAFKTYVVNIGVNFVKQGLDSVFGGIFGNQSQSGSRTGNIFGDIKNVFDSMNGTLQSTIEDIGGKIADWGVDTFGQNSFLADLGGKIGQYSQLISKAAPYLGSVTSLLNGDFKGAGFSAVGTYLGSLTPLGPIGGAIGGMIGKAVGGLFGGKKLPKRTGAISDLNFIDGVTTTKTRKTKKFNINKSIASALGSSNQSFVDSIKALNSMFGINEDIQLSTRYMGRDGGSSYKFLRGNIGGRALDISTPKGKFGEKDLQDFINKITGEYLAKAIQSTGVPEAIKKLFAGLTDAKSVQTMIATSGQLNAAQKKLAERFGLTIDNSVTMAKQLGLTGESLAVYLSQLSEAALGTRNNNEVLEDMRKKLTNVFGKELPSDINKFDEYIKSVDKTTDAGLKRVSDLLSIRSAFIEYDAALDSFNNTLIDSATALGLIDSNLYADLSSFQTAKALAGQGITGVYNSTNANLNGKIMTETLVALRQGIAQLIEESKRTSDNTLTTARTLLNVTDGTTLLTSAT